MFYGRVDVYWPDGPVESYRLNKTTIAVGRSTGNDIVLDTTAISRYHITLSFTDHQVFLEDLDSVNGTYADGVRLQPHTPHLLRGGEEIQIGEIRLIFHPPLEEATIPTEADSTQRVVLSQPTFKVELEGPDIPVAPGAHVKARLKVENLGTDTDRFQIELEGLPKGWARIDTHELELQPGEQNQAMISLKPLRRSESQPGDHAFVVRVRSKSTPTETIDAPAVLHVLSYSGFGMALHETHLQEHNEFQLYVHNQGNAPLKLSLNGTDLAQMLQFQLGQELIQLGPGERSTISGGIRPRQRRFFGAEREHEFALVARAHDPSGFVATVPGSFVEKGLLPPWVPVLAVPILVLAVLLLIAVVLWVVGGNDEEPAIQPAIARFTVSQSTLTVGDAVTVSWEVSDAKRLTLTREREGTQQQFEIGPELSSFVLPFEQTGRYTLALNVENGELNSTSTAAVDVLPVVSLQLQVLDGPELIRNVQHTMRAIWQVQGAQTFDNGYRIWLERADILQPIVSAPQPLSAQYDFPIVVENDQSELTITLYAEGQDGVTAFVTEQLMTVYPSCELRAEQVILRQGPDRAYAPVGEPLVSPTEGSLSFSPLARDSSGQWLQVTVGVENIRMGWVPLADFNCTNFDPSRLTPSNDYPPLPEPTAVPPSPTVSPSLVPTIVSTPLPTASSE